MGKELINDPLMNQDVWSLKKLGYSEEECRLSGHHNLYFENFSLSWLKILTKLTIKVMLMEKKSLSTIYDRNQYLKKLDKFLIFKLSLNPHELTDSILQEFIDQEGSKYRQATISYIARLWTEEQWFKINFIGRKFKQKPINIRIIPEEVLYQIYNNFALFPTPLERLFRLQLVLGCRISELLIMPRSCLKKEGEQWFLLRWIGKLKHWRFYQIHPLVVELIQEQQQFINTQFGEDSHFDKLFCKLSTATMDGAKRGKRFQVNPVYLPELLSNSLIYRWLRDFGDEADLRDKDGKRFYLTSHMFRRTKASIMAHCEVEDEYIAAVLGHTE